MLKIMTYNIQHGLNYRKIKYDNVRSVELEKVSKIVLDMDIDFLAVNEIYGKGFNENDNEFFDHVTYLAKLLNFPYYYFSKAINAKNGEYGNAIFSKRPIKNVKVYKVEDPIHDLNAPRYESRVITKSQIEENGKTIDIISTHFGLMQDEEENAYKLFTSLYDKNNPTVFLGDLNLVPTDDIIQRINKMMKEATIECLGKVKFTHRSIDPDEKIDYIFYNNLKLINADVVDYVFSDHLPVFASFEA